MTDERPGALHSGPSKQDYATPRVFLDAVEKRFGEIAVDLAAHERNAVVPAFVGEEQNSLELAWETLTDVTCWLNPPYNDVTPWAEKLANSGIRGYFLVPASVGANWFWNFVLPYSEVYCVGRMAFSIGRDEEGKEIFLLDKKGKPQVFNRDLILAVYGPEVRRGIFERWLWRTS